MTKQGLSKPDFASQCCCNERNIAGAINHAIDCMNEIREMLHTNPLALSVAIPSTATPPAPHNFLPTPPDTSPEAADGRLASQASQILVGDVTIDPTICGQLAVAFLTDSTLCRMYIDLTDPLVHQSFAIGWFNKQNSTQSTIPPISSSPAISTVAYSAAASLAPPITSIASGNSHATTSDQVAFTGASEGLAPVQSDSFPEQFEQFVGLQFDDMSTSGHNPFPLYFDPPYSNQ